MSETGVPKIRQHYWRLCVGAVYVTPQMLELRSGAVYRLSGRVYRPLMCDIVLCGKRRTTHFTYILPNWVLRIAHLPKTRFTLLPRVHRQERASSHIKTNHRAVQTHMQVCCYTASAANQYCF
jgi:hypothetical protein